MRHTLIAAAGIVALAAAAGIAARDLGFNENAWGVIVGLATFFTCIAHERLARR